MHPFHRKHAGGGVQQGCKSHGLGRLRNGDRDENGEYKDPREEYDETLQETMEYNRAHPKKYPPVLSKNALKEKESVLLESLNAFKSRTSYDNKTRLGPDKENTFQNLKRSRSTSAMEQASLLPSSVSNSLLCEPSCDTFFRAKSKSVSLPQSDNEETETPVASRKNSDHSQNLLFCNKINTECDSKPVENIEVNKTCDIDTSEVESSDGSNRRCNLVSIDLGNDCEENTSSLEIKTDQSCTDSDNIKPVLINISGPSYKENTRKVSKKKDKLLSLSCNNDRNTIEKDEGVEDWDDEKSEGDEEVEFVPFKLSSVIALKKLILGSAIKSFTHQWMGQSFILSTNPKFRYGFVQNKGGSCGVLAAVQGFLLKFLLFHPSVATSAVDPLRPTRQEVRKALIHALTEILWRAGGYKQAVLVRSNQECHLEECLVYLPDGLTEALSWKKFFREKDLQEAVEQHLDEFISPLGKGCLRLIISVILSCGIQSVLGDMDDETSPLIGPSGTCSLELVNLLLTGRAVSNVFDNDLQLDSCLLRGVSKRSEIGFLSIFEHFNSCQVGSNLKTPRYPIWLVNSENHFSVVFSPCKQLVSDWRAERQFHLYHYDGLVSPAEETVLSVDTTGFSVNDTMKRDNVPPLELCIKTKWKDAVVHWSSNPS